MRLLLTVVWIVGAHAADQAPLQARQGEVLRVHGEAPMTAARMEGRTVRLFPQGEGGLLGLMPVPVKTKPGTYRLEWLDARGSVVRSVPVTVRDARFPTQNISLSPDVAELQPAPGEMVTVKAFREAVTDERFWAEPLAVPVPGCRTSPFGVQRLHNGRPTGNFHGGLDQRGPEGEPVRAVADGVVRVQRMFNVHGGTVGIDHGQGLSSLYLHLSAFHTQEGARVRKGDVIGAVGTTGRSTAPHLHWVVFANGVPVNPAQWVEVKPCAAAKPVRKARRRRR